MPIHYAKDGHVVTAPNPYTKGAMMCDPGTFSAGGMADTLKRINMFRWMDGLADVTDDHLPVRHGGRHHASSRSPATKALRASS